MSKNSNSIGMGPPRWGRPFIFFEKKKCQSSPSWAFKPSPSRSNRLLNFGLRDLTDSMTFSSAPKALQSIENTHRKQSVSLFLKSLEFYTSSIELSDDGKMGRIYRQPKANMGKMRKKEEKTRQKLRGRFAP